MIQVFTGTGNGKTLTAIGAAVKIAGENKKVIFTQFLKNGKDSEITILQKVDKIAVLLPEAVDEQYRMLAQDEQERVYDAMKQHLERILNLVKSGVCDMLVLDGILDVYAYSKEDSQILLSFLAEYGNKMLIVLTGEQLTHGLLEVVDYITDIKRIKGVEERCYREEDVTV